MKETYQLIEGSLTFRDLNAENGFLWCPFGCIERQNDPGILISRLDDGSYDVRLGIGPDSPVRFAIRDLEWSWMDMVMDETVELTFPDDMALNDWIASETTATGAGAVVATDKATAYIDVLHDLKVASHESYDSKDRSEGTINRINTVHSLLESFMARFKGVSTKHLAAYLDWFRWCRTFMATDSRTAESTVARQLANGTCATRIRDMFNVLPPYMDYWVASAA